MSNLEKKLFKGNIYVKVTKDKPYGKFKKLKDFIPEEFMEMALKDLLEMSSGRNLVFKRTTDGKYNLVYKVGMYGTLIISIWDDVNLKKCLACPWLKMYFMTAFNFAMEKLVYPVIEKEET